MESNQDRSLIPRPSHELTALQIGGNRILGEMVENSLTLARDAAYEAEQVDLLVREARRIQRSGAGTAAGEVEAFNLFLQAAKAGHSEAQYEVGFCFAFAVGVGYDSVKSEQWIGLAAENGFAPAQNKVANGLSGQGKVSEAAEWYRKGAEQGDPASQISLSDCYRFGKGLLQDYVRAYAWARLAGDADEATPTVSGDMWWGPEMSQEQAEEIAARLSARQLDQASELYLEYKRKYSAKR